jgi:hypothetical protein
MATVLERITPAKAKKPEAGTINWLNDCIERGKRERFTQEILVTPGLAAELLRRNPDNRSLKPTKIAHFASDMRAGRWAFNGETLKISKDGLLNDGQNRLTALIEANEVLPFLFVFGVERDSRRTLDQGTARSAGDYLQMGGCSYAKNAATTAKYVMAFERCDGRNLSPRNSITNAEVVARVEADDNIIHAAAYAHRHYKSYRHLVSHSMIATAHYLLSEINSGDAEEYLDQVCVGENIKRGDPAFAVREALARERLYREDALEIIFHGWNRFRSGQTLKLVKSNHSFPALV